MSDNDYAGARDRFALLCSHMAPPHKKAERLAMAPAEFDAFCGRRDVVSVAVSETAFGFATAPLVMQGDEGLRHAGEFVVVIEAANPGITIRNLDCLAQGQPHPHVGNEPCFGDTNKNSIATLRGKGHLAHLGTFLIRFLELYNSQTAIGGSVCIHAWPLLTAEEVHQWKSRQR